MPQALPVDMAGCEMRGHEEVQGAADGLCRGQANSSSQQEQSEVSEDRRIMRLETWTAEEEQSVEKEEPPGAEEKALQRKRQVRSTSTDA